MKFISPGGLSHFLLINEREQNNPENPVKINKIFNEAIRIIKIKIDHLHLIKSHLFKIWNAQLR